VPFQGRNIEETMEMIKKGNIVKKQRDWRDEESRLGSKGWDEIKGH
jgi:hypothetical protein